MPERIRGPVLYNGPVETLVRAMFLVEAAHPTAMTAEDLSPFDHAVIYTADFGGPANLHHAQANRGDEIPVRLRLLAPALELGATEGFFDRVFEDGTVRYKAGDDLPSDLELFDVPGYPMEERARWIMEKFDKGSESGRAELHALIAGRDSLREEVDWSDESRTVERFEGLDGVYGSDLGRMESLANAAEALSVIRFSRRREALREAGDPAAATMRHEIEPGMLDLRNAALLEHAKVGRDRRDLAATIIDLKGRGPATDEEAANG